MTIILVTQEIGSHGDEVAAGIAACLGLELVTQERVEQRVAERLQISEFTLRRLLHGTASVVERWTIGRRRLVRHMTGEVVSFAGRGNVVVQSWAGTALLRRIRHVICVHVCASTEQNTPRPKRALCCKAQQRTGMNPSLIAAKCDDLACYDLVLDTKQTPVEECVEQVRQLARASQFQRTAASRGLLASLLQDIRTRAAPAPEVDVAGDTIILPTGASEEEAIARVEQHLRGKTGYGSQAAFGSWPITQQGLF